MKAPDKIYLNSSDGDYEFADWNPLPYEKITTEYIRKETLLEWAEEYLSLKIYDTKRDVMEDLIDKLNSM